MSVETNKIIKSESGTRITVGLDIGTTKICALVASIDEDTQNLKILGIGISESEGMSRGLVVNIEKATKAIKNVIQQAQDQSGIQINEVNIGIASDHIESIQSRGIITSSSPTKEISKSDIDRLLDEARKINIPSDRKILHVLPQDFIIDGQDGIQDPVGMSGVRIEANVHIITGLTSAINNITRCVERAGLKIKHMVLEPLASAKAVLSDEEKEVGVAIVDVGGGTTDIAIFTDKILRHTTVFGIAGNQVTNDLLQGLKITLANAEKVKKEFGHTYPNSIVHNEIIQIPGIQGRRPQEISKHALCEILQPRIAEIFGIVFSEIKASGYLNRLGAGVVITGGTTLLRGTDELAQDVLNMAVRIGIPSGITYVGLAPEVENPLYATAVGLALWGIDDDQQTLNQNRIDDEITSGTTANQNATSYMDKPYSLPKKPEYFENNNKSAEDVKSESNVQKTTTNAINKIKDFLKQL